MRRYTQEEMNEILRLATAAQKHEARLSGEYSLEEILKVAGEVGLDPGRIEQAAIQLDAKQQSSLGKKLWHDSLVIPLTAPPTDEEWEQTVAKLREAVGSVGTIREASNGALEWTGNSNGNTYIAVMHRNPDNPRFTLTADRRGTEAVVWTIGLTASIFGTALAAGLLSKVVAPGMGPVLAAGAVGAAATGVWGALRIGGKLGREKTIEIRDHIVSMIGNRSRTDDHNQSLVVEPEVDVVEVQEQK